MQTSPRFRAVLAMGLLLAGWTSSQAQLTPPNSGVINVRTDLTALGIHSSNAAGNGVVDDTAALRAAIAYAVSSNDRYFRPRILFLPDGTYRLTDQLLSKSTDTSWSSGWRSGMILMGQSRNGTILKLDDNRAGFTDSSAQKALIVTGSENPASAADGGGNQAFRHQILNLTVDVGSGNSGANGIDFNASNRGAIRNVTIRTSGANRVGVNGLKLSKAGDGVGPCLIKDVRIDGFSTGIYASTYDYSVTFEDITLANQLTQGIVNDNAALFIRRLTSSIAKPVIRNRQSNGLVVLLESSMASGTNATTAITNQGVLFARDLQATGFGTVIANQLGGAANVAGSSGTVSVGEYASHGVHKAFASSASASLRLGVEETPAYTNTNYSSDWANVISYGATRDDSSNDDRQAIQDAIDSGKPVVYFPQGAYHVSGPVIVRGSVRLLVGYEAVVLKRSGFSGPELVRFDSTATVINERLNWRGNSTHNSSGTWVFRHCDFNEDGAAEFRNTAAGNAGRTFVEDCMAPRIRLSGGHRMWARQMNVETNQTAIVNDGSFLWVLGLKTELTSAVRVENKNGGATEILGGFFFANTSQTGSGTPMVINSNGQLAMSYIQSRSQWTYQVRETRGSQTADLLRSQVPSRGDGTKVALYSGHDGATVIGTSGSYNNNGNTREKAFDGSLSTFFDAPTADGAWVGLDFGAERNLRVLRFAPRASWNSRMVGGQFQASNSADFSSGVVTLRTIGSAPAYNVLTGFNTRANGFRYVRYRSPNGGFCNVAELDFLLDTDLAIIGTAGSYNNNGNTRENVFDGNLNTFFDAPSGGGGWAGLDLQRAENIVRVRYAPRASWGSRMVGGKFQASNSADFSSATVDLHTISSTPADNAYVTVEVAASGYRYVRYLSPANGFCNIAEFEVDVAP